MKTIEYYGETFVGVPDWVNWVAMDCDRMIYGFECEPTFINDQYEGYYWSNTPTTKVINLGIYTKVEKLVIKV